MWEQIAAEGQGKVIRVRVECTIMTHTVLSPSSMNQLTVVPPSGLGAAHDGAQDAKLVELWLSMKTSAHTRRAYAAEAARFLAFVQKPLS